MKDCWQEIEIKYYEDNILRAEKKIEYWEKHLKVWKKRLKELCESKERDQAASENISKS